MFCITITSHVGLGQNYQPTIVPKSSNNCTTLVDFQVDYS